MDTAVAILLNNRIIKTSESKDSLKVDIAYPDALVLMAKSLFSSSRTYKFRLHNSSTFTSSGAGLFNQCVSFANYASTALEWSALASLFEVCKLAKATIRMTSLQGPTSAVLQSQLVIGYNPTNVSAVTTGYNLTSRLPRTKYYHTYHMDGNGSFTMTAQPPRGRDWAIVSSTPYSTSPPGGVIGSFDIASATSLTNSTNYATFSLWVDVEFMNRA